MYRNTSSTHRVLQCTVYCNTRSTPEYYSVLCTIIPGVHQSTTVYCNTTSTQCSTDSVCCNTKSTHRVLQCTVYCNTRCTLEYYSVLCTVIPGVHQRTVVFAYMYVFPSVVGRVRVRWFYTGGQWPYNQHHSLLLEYQGSLIEVRGSVENSCNISTKWSPISSQPKWTRKSTYTWNPSERESAKR